MIQLKTQRNFQLHSLSICPILPIIPVCLRWSLPPFLYERFSMGHSYDVNQKNDSLALG